MIRYQEKDILRIAKRINNSRRPYLLVNPLQAKHIPVSPSTALQMMTSLGELVAAKYGDARLVIGFAETATAIGAVVAKTISDECLYIHTTRENVTAVKDYILFTEEHSHATEQKIVADNLNNFFSKTKTIILVDDEFSTGKTLINMVNRLRACYPSIVGKKIVAASIINRLSEDNLQRWRDEGIESVCLLKLDNTDYSSAVESINVEASSLCSNEYSRSGYSTSVLAQSLPDPRLGVVISDYYESCVSKIDLLKSRCAFQGKDVLILGTEECMLPALLIGKAIEDEKDVKSIKCHATTRSPIGVSKLPGYPIEAGFRVHSLYDSRRDTFIYNLQSYDVAVIVSDAKGAYNRGLFELSMILEEFGCQEILCLAGADDV